MYGLLEEYYYLVLPNNAATSSTLAILLSSQQLLARKTSQIKLCFEWIIELRVKDIQVLFANDDILVSRYILCIPIINRYAYCIIDDIQVNIPISWGCLGGNASRDHTDQESRVPR